MKDLGVAVVTGASRGIGRAIALALGQKGYVIAGTATSAAGASAISEYLAEQGIAGGGFCLNVCDSANIPSFLSEVSASFSTPAVLVNNAGITDDNLFLRMRTEQWDQVIETNLSSLYHMTKACLKPMIKARHGRVVNVGSVVGLTGNPGQANYSASKAGIVAFSKSLAIEYAKKNININCVSPGFIKTEMTDKINEEFKNNLINKIPSGTLGTGEDVSNCVAFLASEMSNYINGETIHVNGGMYMS